MSRRRFTDKQKRNLVLKFERDGGRATDFCRKHKLSCQSLHRWRREWKAAKGAAEPAQFVELEVEAARRSHARPGPAVELDLGGGMVLRIYRGHGE